VERSGGREAAAGCGGPGMSTPVTVRRTKELMCRYFPFRTPSEDDRMRKHVYPSHTRAELSELRVATPRIAPERASWACPPPGEDRVDAFVVGACVLAADHERAVGVLMSPASGESQDRAAGAARSSFLDRGYRARG
jgi:hypothetical protein